MDNSCQRKGRNWISGIALSYHVFLSYNPILFFLFCRNCMCDLSDFSVFLTSVFNPSVGPSVCQSAGLPDHAVRLSVCMPVCLRVCLHVDSVCYSETGILLWMSLSVDSVCYSETGLQ